MKATAERSSPKASTVSRASPTLVARSAANSFIAPSTVARVQPKLEVSRPADPLEREADHVAGRVMRMPGGGGERITASGADSIQRAAQAGGGGGIAVSESDIRSQLSGGVPLHRDIRAFMEPRFGADFSAVRVHVDEGAAQLSNRLGARAFTYQNHIFFGRDQYQPQTDEGGTLIAHELTHTIQQGSAIQRKEDVTVSSAAPTVQRLGIQDVLDYFAEKAANIPGYTMLTFLLGFNPISMRSVTRNAANFLRAFIELLPGGHVITEALENHGLIAKVATWVEQKIAILGDIGSMIVDGLGRFIDSLGWRDVFHLGRVWDRAKRIFTEPIDKLIDFGVGLAKDILKMVKDAILRPLAKLAEGSAGYDLLKAILGEDPVTGEKVERNADTLIGGFMKLIHQEEIWENIKKANAIARCWAWFRGALSELLGFVAEIPGLFIAALKSLEFIDVLLVPRAFLKVGRVFAGFVGRFISWAGNAMWNLLELIFEVVSPATLSYLRKTGAALKSILKNPLPFMRNLLAAAKLGLNNFVGNFVEHLKAGLIDWLTGSLPGIYLPKSFAPMEIGKFVLSILGVSWGNIRAKLVNVVGEPVVKTLETGFDIVVALVTEGPAAAWEQIKSSLTNLKDMVIDGIVSFVKDSVIQKAIPKLISMFVPGAGFISAIVSIYDTIMVFVHKLAKIVAVVKSFVDSIVAIAGGAIAAAAKLVEGALAGILSLAINFLAGFIGLGNVAEKLMGVVGKVRAVVDKAIDKLIEFIVTGAKALFSKGKAAVGAVAEWWKKKTPFTTAGGHKHEISYVGDEKSAVPMVASTPRNAFAVLDDFEGQAKKSGASDEEKKAVALIVATRNALKAAPNDPNLAVNMKSLMETFEEAGFKKTSITYETGTLGGAEVGLAMRADWLAKDLPGGSAPKSGQQSQLMSKLETDPGESSPDKYIRGHLLNENLGGPGVSKNLFPITGKANSAHLHSTESSIKSWVNTQNQYAFYEVRVVDVSSKLNSTKGTAGNFVNCTFVCRAILKDAKGNVHKDFTTAVPSVFGHREQAAKVDNTTGQLVM